MPAARVTAVTRRRIQVAARPLRALVWLRTPGIVYGSRVKRLGQCHCGAIRFMFETEKPLAPRACQCSFCRKHNARTVADPAGAAVLGLGPEAMRYRFGSKTSDYLICGRCGIYAGATAEIDGQLYATLNLNAFDDPRLDLEGRPISYDGEDAAGKAGRRRVKWTPARMAESASLPEMTDSI